jgi:hypothetical protein
MFHIFALFSYKTFLQQRLQNNGLHLFSTNNPRDTKSECAKCRWIYGAGFDKFTFYARLNCEQIFKVMHVFLFAWSIQYTTKYVRAMHSDNTTVLIESFENRSLVKVNDFVVESLSNTTEDAELEGKNNFFLVLLWIFKNNVKKKNNQVPL